MEEYDEIIKSIEDHDKLLQKIEKELSRFIKRVKRQLLTVALTGIAGYAFDKFRKSRLTVSNITQTNRIAARIEARGNKGKKSLIKFLLDSLLKILDSNKEFYTPQGSTQSIDDAARKRILLLYGYDVDKKQIIKGGYLDQATSFSGIAAQVAQTLNGSVASRQSLTQMRKSLLSAMGATKQGIVGSHFTRFTRDFFAEVDRAAKLEYKERLGLKHALYAGTAIATTRDFCEDRLNNVYTEKEIMKWNNQRWKGKKPGDVRIVCGGYNCRHALNWISPQMAEILASRLGGMNNYN